MRLHELYRHTASRNIPVVMYPMPECGSMSIQTERGCFIGLDRSVCDNAANEMTHLAHEMGHCVTGSFYSELTPLNTRQRHENRADKWAIRTLIPARELDEAVASGCTQMWELAEHFGVTEDFMRKAVSLHVHGNLATDLNF